MSLIEITEDQYNDFMNLDTGRVKNIPANYVGRTAQPVSNIKKGDTIYVFPNSTIKKLPLRKWMKAIGAKPVFKAEEASVIVTPAKFTGDDYKGQMQLKKGYIIPQGKYYYKNGGHSCYRTITCPTGEYYTVEDAVILYYNTDIYNERRGDYVYSNSVHYKDVIRALNNKYQTSYNLTTIKGLTSSEFYALIDTNKTIINDRDFQQVLYDWEVENKVREKNEDYSWQGIEDLLLSNDNDNATIALRIIEKIEIEPFMFKLCAIFLSEKLDIESRKYMYKHIFSRKPVILELLTKPGNSYRCFETEIGIFIRGCMANNIAYDLTYFKKVGWDIHLNPNNKVTIYPASCI